MPRTKKTTTVPLMLRLPPELHAMIVEAANTLGLSMNEYIVDTMEQRLHGGSKDVDDALRDRLAFLEKRVDELSSSFTSLTQTLSPSSIPSGEAVGAPSIIQKSPQG